MKGAVRTLYGLKLRMFLGSLRRQHAALVAFALLAAMFLPGAFGFGYLLPDAPILPGGSLLEMGALALSVFAAFLFASVPGGGLLLQPAEVDFVAVAPVTVRQFVLADLLFQATVYGAGLPLVVLAAAGYAVRTGGPLWAVLVPAGALLVLLVTIVLVLQTLGIARLLGKAWSGPLAVALFAGLVLPAALRFGLRVPLGYATLPYPTTAAMQIALLPFGFGDPIGVPLLLAYAAVAVLAHAWATGRPALPNLRGTFALTFDLQARRRQQEALLRAFGRLRRERGSRIYRGTILGTMAVLHGVRMARDGTLFMAALLAVMFSVLFVGVGEGAVVGAGVYVTVVIPVIAAAQWMVSDRSNLWILLVSGRRPEDFYVGWWSILAAFVGTLSALLFLASGLVLGRLDGLGAAAAIAASLGACAGTVIASARFPYAPNEFSLLPIVHLVLTGTGAGFGTLVVYALTAALGPVLAGSAFAALLGVAFTGYVSYLAARRYCRAPKP